HSYYKKDKLMLFTIYETFRFNNDLLDYLKDIELFIIHKFKHEIKSMINFIKKIKLCNKCYKGKSYIKGLLEYLTIVKHVKLQKDNISDKDILITFIDNLYNYEDVFKLLHGNIHICN